MKNNFEYYDQMQAHLDAGGKISPQQRLDLTIWQQKVIFSRPGRYPSSGHEDNDLDESNWSDFGSN